MNGEGRGGGGKEANFHYSHDPHEKDKIVRCSGGLMENKMKGPGAESGEKKLSLTWARK